MRAKINYNAMNTWLEPYIGYVVDVQKMSKNILWFLWEEDNAMYSPKIMKHDRFNFDIF